MLLIVQRELVSTLLSTEILNVGSDGRESALRLLEKLLTQVLCDCDESLSPAGQVDAILIPWAGESTFKTYFLTDV